MLSIRTATPADVPAIHAMILGLAEYERLLDQVDATEASLQASLFAQPARVFCDVAHWTDASGTSAAGFALWFYSYSTFRGRHGLYLEDLFVQPAHRGRGIGRALLVQLARRCVTEDLARLEWSVLDWNEPALRFYRALGAQPLDDWTVHRVTGTALATLAADAPRGAP